MRTRPVLLAVASATLGMVAIGVAVAQQPLPTGYNQPSYRNTSSGYPQPKTPGTFPGSTVRPYTDWTPGQQPPGYVTRQPQPVGVQPAGGYLPPPAGYTPPPAPPGYAPVGSSGRLTKPVMAGPDGVRPAGGFDIPPPDMGELPPYRPGGVTPPPPDSKFLPSTPLPPASAPGVYVDPKPGVPPLPPATLAPGGAAPPLPPPSIVPTVPAAPPSHPAAPPTDPTAPPVGPTMSAPNAALLPARSATSVVVEAVCPESVVFGQEYAYKLIVRNTGSAAVTHVRVEDEIPVGARYVGSDQQVELSGDRLVWMVGTLEVGAERHVSIRVRPGEEGEIRSRATVSFAAAVDARTRVTRPRLAVNVAAAEISRAGEETIFHIKVTNSGSGPAAKLILQARLSDGLVHAQGLVIEAELPELPAGATKSIPLKVSAAKAGLQSCQIVVSADGSPDASAKASLNVVEPMLVVKQTGPAHCLVRSEPTYTIELANPGTATTDPVQVYAVLPEGFDFVQASDGGGVDGRTVAWRLPSLAAGSTRSLTLKLRAVSASEGMLRTIAQAAPPAVAPVGGAPARAAGRGLEAKVETPVTAEGVAAIRFDVAVLENPVEVGKEAVYEIRVTNQGTGPCTNVQIAAALSEGTEFVGVGPNPPSAAKATGQSLVFEPLPTLGVKGEAVYRVRVKGNVAGDLRFRVQLTSDQLKTPIIKEEGTRFYKQ